MLLEVVVVLVAMVKAKYKLSLDSFSYRNSDDGFSKKLQLFNLKVCIYQLAPKSRVLLEKLTGFQLVKKFPALYGTRMFNTTFTKANHLPLS